MKTCKPVQLKSINEIDTFISKCSTFGSDYFEDIYDGIAYVYSPQKEEKEFVNEFNKAIKDIFKLVSK